MSEPTPQQEAVIEAAKKNYAHRQRCSVRAGCEECAFHRAVLDDKVRMLIAIEQPWKIAPGGDILGPRHMQLRMICKGDRLGDDAGFVVDLLNRASRASDG